MNERALNVKYIYINFCWEKCVRQLAESTYKLLKITQSDKLFFSLSQFFFFATLNFLASQLAIQIEKVIGA